MLRYQSATAWNCGRSLASSRRISAQPTSSLDHSDNLRDCRSTVLGSLNGYVFSKWKFKGSEVVFTLFLFGMFIPYQVILIPLFQTLRAMDLYGGLPGLILAHIVYGLPITSLIFRNFYSQIPTALIESARLDGAGFFSIYLRIVFPLSIPGFVVTSLCSSPDLE